MTDPVKSVSDELEGLPPAPYRVIAGLVGSDIAFLVLDADNFDVAKTRSESVARAIAALPEQRRKDAERIRELEADKADWMRLAEKSRQDRDAIEAKTRAETRAETIERIKNSLDYRLNEWLCEMKPDYDDSITGFNEAWDIMRKYMRSLATPAATGAA